MADASRKPIGHPTTCPICGTEPQVAPNEMVGEIHCHQCASQLWFIQPSAWPVDLQSNDARMATQFFDCKTTSSQQSDTLLEVAEHFGIRRSSLESNNTVTNAIYRNLAYDELDGVELLMQIESVVRFGSASELRK